MMEIKYLMRMECHEGIPDREQSYIRCVDTFNVQEEKLAKNKLIQLLMEYGARNCKYEYREEIGFML